jgi:hypothetical protein
MTDAVLESAPSSSARRPVRAVITCRTTAPLHHGAFGQDGGNIALFRRLPIAVDGAVVNLPCVSGNALRARLRRLVMRDLFQRVGLSRHSEDLTPVKWDKLYAAVANGGTLKGKEVEVSPADRLALRAAVPPLSTFGAAIYAWMLHGLVSAGWVLPVCQESVKAGLVELGDGVDPSALLAAEELIAEVSQTRHVDADDQDPSITDVGPMPVTVEAIMPGVEFQSEWLQLQAMTPIEWGAIAYGLSLLTGLGGKAASGFGRLDITHTIPEDALTAYLEWLSDADAMAQARAALVGLTQGW